MRSNFSNHSLKTAVLAVSVLLLGASWPSPSSRST